MSLMVLVSGMTPALGQLQSGGSAEQGTTHMDQIDMSNPQSGQTLVPPPAKPEEKSAFIHDSKFSGQLRTFYFDRKKFDDSYSEAWTLRRLDRVPVRAIWPISSVSARSSIRRSRCMRLMTATAPCC